MSRYCMFKIFINYFIK
uniref:BLTX244 n=1 Tax=Nephila pilipes TaxID=299642 RepID=A0A076KZR5_NEPPI|nr:BLTX244 [Nephila pilipes]AII98122.1 BLTX820 [Nephila pilipes]